MDLQSQGCQPRRIAGAPWKGSGWCRPEMTMAAAVGYLAGTLDTTGLAVRGLHQALNHRLLPLGHAIHRFAFPGL
jgi:hypothetical protein